MHTLFFFYFHLSAFRRGLPRKPSALLTREEQMPLYLSLASQTVEGAGVAS